MPRSGTRARSRSGAFVPAAVVASLLLAGCTVEPPAPSPEAQVVAAVVSETQERKILASVAETIAEHDKASAAEGLRARVTGPALSLREAELRLVAATGEKTWRTDLLTGTQHMVLPSDPGWPRTSYAIQAPRHEKAAPALLVLDQSSPRDQYRLWGYVTLVPGASLPLFAPPGLGSAAVRPDDATSLLLSPQEALAGYAQVLGEDTAAPDAGTFADDRLRQDLREIETSQTDVPDWRTTGGKYSFVAEVDPDPGLRALRTADGGALVIGALTSTQAITLGQEGAVIDTDALPPAQRALSGDAEATDRLSTRYRDLVALHVPAAGSQQKIALVGFAHVPVDVSHG